MKKIRIGGKDFEIRVVDNLDDKDGTIEYNQRLIRIVKNHPGLMKSTLLHETLHALSFMFDLNLSESQIIRLEEGLMMILNDNPKLIDYLK